MQEACMACHADDLHHATNAILWLMTSYGERSSVPRSRHTKNRLDSSKGKRPDGATLIPWSRGQALARDVTIPDTYAASHLQSNAFEAGREAIHAAEIKCTKYRELDATHIFVAIAIETAGTWDKQATELIEEIGRRCTLETEDPKETIYLYQRISITIQRGNALSFTHMFDIYADINT